MTLIYDKNRLLLFLLVVLLSWFYIPKIYRLITFASIKGTCVNFTYEKNKVNVNGRRSSEEIYRQLVEIEVDGKKYAFESEPSIFEMPVRGKAVPVKYNRKDPSIAFVNTFDGYWFSPVIYIFPIMVVSAGLVLAIGMRIAAQKNKMIQDSGITIKVEEEI